MSDLESMLAVAVEALRAEQAKRAVQWSELYIAIGQARGAATGPAAYKVLYGAETLLCELTGSYAALAPVMEWLEERPDDAGSE